MDNKTFLAGPSLGIDDASAPWIADFYIAQEKGGYEPVLGQVRIPFHNLTKLKDNREEMLLQEIDRFTSGGDDFGDGEIKSEEQILTLTRLLYQSEIIRFQEVLDKKVSLDGADVPYLISISHRLVVQNYMTYCEESLNMLETDTPSTDAPFQNVPTGSLKVQDGNISKPKYRQAAVISAIRNYKVTSETAEEVAKIFGLPSGQEFFEKYQLYSNESLRRRGDTKRTLKARVRCFKSVLSLLNPDERQLLESDINALNKLLDELN